MITNKNKKIVKEKTHAAKIKRKKCAKKKNKSHTKNGR